MSAFRKRAPSPQRGSPNSLYNPHILSTRTSSGSRRWGACTFCCCGLAMARVSRPVVHIVSSLVLYFCRLLASMIQHPWLF